MRYGGYRGDSRRRARRYIYIYIEVEKSLKQQIILAHTDVFDNPLCCSPLLPHETHRTRAHAGGLRG